VLILLTVDQIGKDSMICHCKFNW